MTTVTRLHGFGPVSEESEGELHGAHSDQERLRETSMYQLVEFLWGTIIDTAANGSASR